MSTEYRYRMTHKRPTCKWVVCYLAESREQAIEKARIYWGLPKDEKITARRLPQKPAPNT